MSTIFAGVALNQQSCRENLTALGTQPLIFAYHYYHRFLDTHVLSNLLILSYLKYSSRGLYFGVHFKLY